MKILCPECHSSNVICKADEGEMEMRCTNCEYRSDIEQVTYVGEIFDTFKDWLYVGGKDSDFYVTEVTVDNYDDDFCFYYKGDRILEGTTIKGNSKPTILEALMDLLNSLRVVDYNGDFIGQDVPDSYGHVHYARTRINEMLDACKQGYPPTDLHWGGNWDITFNVRRV